jgi:hypothetical protein
MTTKITKRKALELLDKAVEAKGTEYSVKTCTYFNPDTAEPNCIVGYGFKSIGIDMSDLVESSEYYDPNTADISELEVSGYEITPKARSVLGIAQMIQDEGGTWGTARDQARSETY